MKPTYRIAQRLHERRAAVGLPKYGRHLDAESRGCMLVHALEENADKTNYLIAEIQRRKYVIEKLEALAEEMRADKAPRWAFEMEKLSDLLGGPSALKQYDEILGGAENATLAPQSGIPKEQLDRIRQEIAKVAAINRPLTPQEREDFDRAMAELPEAHEAQDPRDEALRVAAEALIHVRHEIIGMANRANGDEWLVAVAHRSVAVIAEALDAIRAAGGAR